MLQSCTQCFYTSKRSHDLQRHILFCHGEGPSHGHGHESSSKRTTPVRTTEQSIISVPECPRALRKPRDTRRIASESVPDVFIIPPSHSRTHIDKPKKKKNRIGPTPNGDSNKKKIVHPKNNSNGSSEAAGLGCKRSIIAPIGVNNRSVYQPKKEKEPNAVDSSLNEEIPEGTVNVQPEAALDGEADGHKSEELRKKFPLELKERKDSNNQNAPPTVKSVLCTVCGTQVNPFYGKTFFCHPVLGVVICKGCLEFYNRVLWKKDEDNIEEECRWCGQGGSLSCCGFCCKAFCKHCIVLNFGIDELKHILKKKWRCYMCDPSPLKVLVDEFSALQARSLETEQNETEKANVYVQKEVVKAPKKEKMQDAAIAKELQYLLTNISNGALFMESLVQLKNWVPDTQNLQMLLKHIGKVKSDLGEFEACVKKQLHGDAHKSDSVLDGIPGSSSAGASQDEGGEKEDKVEKKKDLSSVTGTRKSRRSSTASESESSENSDDNTKPRRRNLSRKKKKCEPEKIDSASEVELKRRELDDNDEKDNDADGDKDDEDEEVDGTGSKRSKKKAVKKAEEDEEWNNSERRQNGTEGGGGSRDDKNGGGDQKKRKRRDPNSDLYKKAKKKKNSRKKKAQKKAKQDEDLNDSETQNGTRGGGGSGDGNNGGDE